MAKREGFVRQMAQPFWRIDDEGGNRLCRYSPVQFPGFADGDPVFFVDDNPPDGIADNVQPRNLVDRLVAVAMPDNGSTAPAALRLHDRVMQELMSNTLALANGQPSTVPAIQQNLAAVANTLNASPSGRATVPMLRSIGI